MVLLANGDIALLISFGTFVLLSFFGVLSMKQRRRRETDPKWQVFMGPFTALLCGLLRFTLVLPCTQSSIGYMALGVVLSVCFRRCEPR
jgi:uncharacterized membrane protein